MRANSGLLLRNIRTLWGERWPVMSNIGILICIVALKILRRRSLRVWGLMLDPGIDGRLSREKWPLGDAMSGRVLGLSVMSSKLTSQLFSVAATVHL